jgi:hypothetical protein
LCTTAAASEQTRRAATGDAKDRPNVRLVPCRRQGFGKQDGSVTGGEVDANETTQEVLRQNCQ